MSGWLVCDLVMVDFLRYLTTLFELRVIT